MTSIRDLQASVWEAECRHDIETLLGYFHPDAIFHASGQSPRHGHEAIKALTEDFYRAFPELEVEILRVWGDDGSRAVIEFRAALKDPGGAEFVVNGVNLVEVEDGRFTYVRSYEELPAPVV